MVKVVWNHRGCGRCGGTGKYHVGLSSGGWRVGTCYSCRGAGDKMSPQTIRNMLAFRAWQKQARPTREQALAELASGRFGKAYKLVYEASAEATQ